MSAEKRMAERLAALQTQMDSLKALGDNALRYAVLKSLLDTPIASLYMMTEGRPRPVRGEDLDREIDRTIEILKEAG